MTPFAYPYPKLSDAQRRNAGQVSMRQIALSLERTIAPTGRGTLRHEPRAVPGFWWGWAVGLFCGVVIVVEWMK